MDEKEIHLRDYLNVIIKRKNIVITFFIVVFVIVFIGTISTTPLYMASSKVVIERADPTVLIGNYSYMHHEPEFYETQYQLIKSAAVSRKVVDMLNLEATYDTYIKNDSGLLPSIGDIVGWFSGLFSSMLGTKKITEEGEEALSKADLLAKTISSGIVVKPVKNSKMAEISYISTNPELARLIANTVAQAYIETILDLNMSSVRHGIEWMTKKAQEEKQKIEQSEKVLQQYMKSHNFITIENKLAIVPQQISELNSMLTKTELKRKELENLYNKVKDISDKGDEAEKVSAIATEPTLQSLRQQIIKSEQNIKELSQKYGSKHPTMLKALEELNLLKAKRDQEIKRIIESIRHEYELSKDNEANLRRRLAETKREAINLNEKMMDYNIINREVETNRQLYEALIKKIKEQGVIEQSRTVNVMIVEKAEKPKSPFKPRKAMNLLLGIIVGFFGGIGIAFFVEYLDNTVKSPDDAESKLGVPVIGMIPLLTTPDNPIEIALVNKPSSSFSESFKAIRTAIILSTAEKPPRKILITSSVPGEGKTVTSINLAVAIAQSGYKVLLIDADLRKPRIHKVFELDNTKGLSTYLAGASGADIIKNSPVEGLNIITAGPVPPNPSELLSSKKMVEILDIYTEMHDFIICDSPPVLTVADSLILSKLLDGTIMVTRADVTTYENAKNCIKSLANVNAHILGIGINAIDINKGAYSSYYYSYHYSSAPEDKGKN